MEGFTEAERISAAWSKLHAMERKLLTNEKSGRYHEGKKSGKKERNSRSRSRDADDYDYVRKRRSYSRGRGNRGNREDREDREDRGRRHGDERKLRDKPSYSPYRGNPEIRKSPTYSPYRGHRENSSPVYDAHDDDDDLRRKIRGSSPRRESERERTQEREKRSRSRSKEKLTDKELARLSPPPDPKRPDYASRYDRIATRKDDRKGRSRSSDHSQHSKVYSKWSHDRFTAADYDSPERDYIPRDYRPPSPKWVSRAGGVAIMKSKKSS